MLNLIKTKFDVIIIGAGLSGLTLANEISKKTKKSVLIIEKKKSFDYDKNWCFWNTPQNVFTKRYDTAWNSIKIKIDKNEIIHEEKNINYLHLKSSTFFKYMTEKLEKNKRVQILNGVEINKIKIKKSKNDIIVGKHKYECELLFDSRYRLIKQMNSLFQHF